MHSIRTKITVLIVAALIVVLSITAMVGILSSRYLGTRDADRMLHLTCTEGAMTLNDRFKSLELSVTTVSSLVQDALEGASSDQLEGQVEFARDLFDKVIRNTEGAFSYYFRIDPEVSDTVKGFWYVKQEGEAFREHEVTDIARYDTNDDSLLLWFTIPKTTGKAAWIPPYYTNNLDTRVISYDVPIYWNGRFVGVIGIEMDYETLAREVEGIHFLKTGYAFIIDANSNFICHPNMNSALLNTPRLVMPTADRTVDDDHIRYHFNGLEKEAAWLSLDNGMLLYVTAPSSEINDGWRSMIWVILVAAFAALVIVGFIVVRVMVRIMKPLDVLTEAAQKVEEGNYEFSLEYSKNDEIGVLTRTFRQLVAHTKERINVLNKRVYVDELTSVRNKGGYAIYVQQLQDWMDDPREPLEFAIAVFNCDNAKSIYETYGQEKGDAYIKTGCSLICHVFRHSPVFRIGEEEFAVILKNDDYLNRDSLIEQLQKQSAESCGAGGNEWEQVHMDMGIAVYDPQVDSSVLDVSRRADQLLYEKMRQ